MRKQTHFKIASVILALLLTSCANNLSEKEAIIKVLEKQQSDWNKGNIAAFMEGYWKSDSLQFIGKDGIKYGWNTTLENYKKSYPDKAAMGKLAFDILQLEINGNTAYMLGKWTLIRSNDSPNGYFTLYWKKINEKWVITIDHTS